MLRKIAFFCIVWPVLAAENTALVAALKGTVTINKTNPVSAFEWLPDGAVLKTGLKSSATVILLNGHRFELGPSARATIGATHLSATAGPIRELDPVPPIPKIAPLSIATGTAAVTAVRGAGKIRGLCPREGMAALAGPVTLSFQKVDGAAAYQVIVQDAEGNSIADEYTKSTEITIPLQPGRHYSWRIRAWGAADVIAENQAGFVTLTSEQIQARKAFADGIRTLADGSALLAEVDLACGLVREAIAGFQAALKLKPDDPALSRGLHRAEFALAGK
jgi:hypothetical protein